MDATNNLVTRLWRHFKRDSLFRNSIWLMASSSALALCGLIFWTIAARQYPASLIGIASTLISIVTLLSTVCLLGLNITLINHLPKAKKPSALINSGVLIVSILAFVGAILFGLVVGHFSPQLIILRQNKLLLASFVLFAILSTADTVVEGALIALKNSSAVFIKNSLYSITKVILILIIGEGLERLLSAYFIGLVVCFVVSYVSLRRFYQYRLRTKITRSSLKNVMKTSLGNYAESISTVLPPAILPLIITIKLGPSHTAYFYLAMVIANSLYTVPKAVARNVIAELSSNNEGDDALPLNHYYHGAKLLAGILLPSLAIIVVFGRVILSIFGHQYSKFGYDPLVFLSLAVIPISVCSLLWANMNAHNESLNLLWTNLAGGIIIIVICYLLIPRGLTAVSIAWFIGQVFQMVFYILPIWRRKNNVVPY